jgi:hypothetical protein
MALTQLQANILQCLAKNRSDSSYLAGGLILNKNWQRRSDDIDIFHDSDEEVVDAANADLALLEAAGYKTHKDFVIYGAVDATVSDGASSTIIQVFRDQASLLSTRERSGVGCPPASGRPGGE